MPDSSDIATLLAAVPADGSTIGNIRLRNALGWDEDRYTAARDALVNSGTLLKGVGKGGSVRRSAAPASAPAADGEMFPAEQVQSTPAPKKPGAAKPTKAPAAEKASPVTTYQFTDATRKNIPPAGVAT